ncbi:MAG: hypothetical protein Q9217_000579 [Psora testacea]
MSLTSSLDSSDTDSEPFQSAQPLRYESAARSNTSIAEGGEPVNLHEQNIEAANTGQQNSASHEGQSPTLSPRPNKLRGPPSTWRRWTAPEREIAASLDRLTAQDLSLHLYNAFKLKQRGLAHQRLGKRQAASVNFESSFASTWVPPKAWTAWPLPSGIVPREDRGEHSNEAAPSQYPYLPRPMRSSHRLRAILVAHALGQAKLKLQDRDWEASPTLSTEAENENVYEVSSNYSTSTVSDDDRGAGNFSSSSKSKQSEAISYDASNFENEHGDSIAASRLTPVVMADDETADSILQPSIMHILAALDSLLMALHRVRSSYLSLHASNVDDQRETEQQSQSKTQSRKHGRSASGRIAGRCSSIEISAASGYEEPGAEAVRRSGLSGYDERFKQRSKKLGLRDWSDVLGVASLTGFDEVAVECSASRCANIFNEGMTFRTLRQDHDSFEERTFPAGQTVPLLQRRPNYSNKSQLQSRSGFAAKGETPEGLHEDGFLQAIQARRSWKSSHRKQG